MAYLLRTGLLSSWLLLGIFSVGCDGGAVERDRCSGCVSDDDSCVEDVFKCGADCAGIVP